MMFSFKPIANVGTGVKIKYTDYRTIVCAKITGWEVYDNKGVIKLNNSINYAELINEKTISS